MWETQAKGKGPILTLQGVGKNYPGVKALRNISFSVEKGTIHGLVGENGAGKSTLINVISGLIKANEGEIFYKGNKVAFATPIEARKAGIGVVHQEIKLSEPLSVTENIFLGSPIAKYGIVDKKAMRQRAKEIVAQFEMDIDVDMPVCELTIAKKQLVEIMHAVICRSELLIMDEPSAVLTSRELNVLFKTVRKLKESGVTIIYISHRLNEIFELCDNVSVLRDGMHVNTLPIEQLDRKKLIALMVGRELGQEYPKEVVAPGETVLKVEHLNCGKLQDISFEVKKGEIFGISGLVDSGRTELARAVLGIDKPKSGKIYVRGKLRRYKNFKQAINDGLGLVPEDRKKQGLVLGMSVMNNASIVDLNKISKFGILSKRAEHDLTARLAKSVHLITPSYERLVRFLSGGNQQKVVLSKWINADSEILFLDEPTRGVDVGAKAEIYKIITGMIKNGKTVIMISSELPEILGMCDRVMVMHGGRKKGEFPIAEATQEKIMALCV